MKTVGNIKKITKAMKMVASSKMKADLNRLNAGKNFGVHIMPTVFAMDPLAARKSVELQALHNDEMKLIVPITSDRGLCGGINSNLVKELKEIVSEDRSKWNICCIGDKGTQALARPFPDLLKLSINEILLPVNFYNIATISEQIIQSNIQFGRIIILYNEFINSLRTCIRQLELMGFSEFKKHFNKLTLYNNISPSKDYAIPYFYSLYVSSKCPIGQYCVYPINWKVSCTTLSSTMLLVNKVPE